MHTIFELQNFICGNNDKSMAILVPSSIFQHLCIETKSLSSVMFPVVIASHVLALLFAMRYQSFPNTFMWLLRGNKETKRNETFHLVVRYCWVLLWRSDQTFVSVYSIVAEWRIMATAACCAKALYFSQWKNSLKCKILWFFAKIAHFYILTLPGGGTLTRNLKKNHFFKGCGEKMAITQFIIGLVPQN